MKPTVVASAAALVALIAVALRPGATPPPEEQALLRPRYSLGLRVLSLQDPRRGTPSTRWWAGSSDQRSLRVWVWYPCPLHARAPPLWKQAARDGPFPVLLYAHSYMGFAWDFAHGAAALARLGYVVVAPDFPMTRLGTAMDLRDMTNQPGDLVFVLNTLLAQSRLQTNWAYRLLDASRVAVGGLSTGAMTAVLTATHPQVGDARIVALLGIGGTSLPFLPPLFANTTGLHGTTMPYLFVAGEYDAVFDYQTDARTVLQRYPPVRLVSIARGSHTGFAWVARWLFQTTSNPDWWGCAAFTPLLPSSNDWVSALGSPRIGIDTAAALQPCARWPLPPSARPERQQHLAMLSSVAFLQAHFAPTDTQRQRGSRFLHQDMPRLYADELRVEWGK